MSAPQPSRTAPPCPLCRGTRATIAHTGSFFLQGLRLDQDTLVCEACGLTRESAHPDQDWLSLYGSVWKRSPAPSARHTALYANDGRLLGPGNGRCAFDVGCDSGHLLDVLQAKGWVTAGCEPDTTAALLAREKGHEVSATVFEDCSPEDIDLLILGDVLEHQPDPLSMLTEARRALRPDGSLYVRVPDLRAVNFETFGDVFGLQHRVWFTPETLGEALAVCGFEAHTTGTFGRGMHAIARLAQPRPWRRPSDEPAHSLQLIRDYSRDMQRRRETIDRRLRKLENKTVALYGAGEHAEELLGFSSLGSIASRVADGNPDLWGKTCGGLRIEEPAELRERPPQSVVIASKAYQDEIAAELQDLAQAGVEILKLYGPEPAPARAHA